MSLRGGAWISLVVLFVLAHGAALAEDAAPAEAAKPDADAGERSYWKGPRVGLSYRLYSLRDDQGGGLVHSGSFAGFLPTRFLRAGGGIEAGARAYEYGATEGLVSGNLFAGYQHLRDLGRVVPYLVALGEFGFVFGKRFHTPRSRSLRGAGVELGANLNLVRTLYVGVGVTFMIYTMDDLSYDTFGLRVSIGL